MKNCRQFAYLALLEIYKKGIYTDIALDTILSSNNINNLDRGLISELVYGIVRRQRTLDHLITQFSKKPADKQPLTLKIILQIGLYQLRYLNNVPPSAAVNTTVDLAKINHLNKLSGVVNGILRSYLRQSEFNEPLILPDHDIEKIAISQSFPTWLIESFVTEIGLKETQELIKWFNQTPSIDIRINPLKTSLEDFKNLFSQHNIKFNSINNLPQALRLEQGSGNIEVLPHFQDGWFTVQDASAQLVAHLLDPQPDELIIDACAAPGGKTTHLAELMGDQGQIFACDLYPKRLQKVQQNCDRLGLKSVQIQSGDSRKFTHFHSLGDRVLLDAPCSGLGTLHKRPDIRWKQKPERIAEIRKLQGELLENCAKWVKKGGILVYATCTLNKAENEDIIEAFLTKNPDWEIAKPAFNFSCVNLVESELGIKIWPHKYNMDGFFMIKLKKG